LESSNEDTFVEGPAKSPKTAEAAQARMNELMNDKAWAKADQRRREAALTEQMTAYHAAEATAVTEMPMSRIRATCRAPARKRCTATGGANPVQSIQGVIVCRPHRANLCRCLHARMLHHQQEQYLRKPRMERNLLRRSNLEG
jgi:hypothetical protein